MKKARASVTGRALVGLCLIGFGAGGASSCGTNPEPAESSAATGAAASAAPTVIVGTAIEASTGLPLGGVTIEAPGGLVVETDEFGRFELEPRFTAVRRFMLDLWAMPIAGLGMKYSIYPNSVLFASGGLTHDEMARKFNSMGLGQGRPIGGGKMQRRKKLAFAYDTASTAFGGQLKPEFVQASIRRWVRLTGGQADKFTLAHQNKLGV